MSGPMRCEDCAWSTEFTDRNDLRSRKFQCRRLPPKPVAFPIQQGPGVAVQQMSLFPVVDAGCFCGEYRDKTDISFMTGLKQNSEA